MNPRLNHLPADISPEHTSLARTTLPVERFRGTVLFYIFRVKEHDNEWSRADKEEAELSLQKNIELLVKTASNYGTDLTIKYVFCDISLAPYNKGWENASYEQDSFYVLKAINKIGRYASLEEFRFEKKFEYKADKVNILLFYINPFRSFAHLSYYHSTYKYYKDSFFTFINLKDPDKYVIAHEVLHLYGARDFYFPKRYVNACTKHFGDSVMNHSNCNNIDPVTAFVVGFTDKLSPSAIGFLQDTAEVTEEEIRKERY